MECQYCGTSFKVCPSCRHANGLHIEICTFCGEPLTIISQVIARHESPRVNPRWLRQTRAKAASIKASEESASLERMDAIMEIENRREEALAREHARRQVQDRRILTIMLVLGVSFVTFVVAAIIWNLLF
jgi:hypothetical protein